MTILLLYTEEKHYVRKYHIASSIFMKIYSKVSGGSYKFPLLLLLLNTIKHIKEKKLQNLVYELSSYHKLTG